MLVLWDILLVLHRNTLVVHVLEHHLEIALLVFHDIGFYRNGIIHLVLFANNGFTLLPAHYNVLISIMANYNITILVNSNISGIAYCNAISTSTYDVRTSVHAWEVVSLGIVPTIELQAAFRWLYHRRVVWIHDSVDLVVYANLAICLAIHIVGYRVVVPLPIRNHSHHRWLLHVVSNIPDWISLSECVVSPGYRASPILEPIYIKGWNSGVIVVVRDILPPSWILTVVEVFELPLAPFTGRQESTHWGNAIEGGPCRWLHMPRILTLTIVAPVRLELNYVVRLPGCVYGQRGFPTKVVAPNFAVGQEPHLRAIWTQSVSNEVIVNRNLLPSVCGLSSERYPGEVYRLCLCVKPYAKMVSVYPLAMPI